VIPVDNPSAAYSVLIPGLPATVNGWMTASGQLLSDGKIAISLCQSAAPPKYLVFDPATETCSPFDFTYAAVRPHLHLMPNNKLYAHYADGNQTQLYNLSDGVSYASSFNMYRLKKYKHYIILNNKIFNTETNTFIDKTVINNVGLIAVSENGYVYQIEINRNISVLKINDNDTITDADTFNMTSLILDSNMNYVFNGCMDINGDIYIPHVSSQMTVGLNIIHTHNPMRASSCVPPSDLSLLPESRYNYLFNI
jgi:hypothetical protein